MVGVGWVALKECCGLEAGDLPGVPSVGMTAGKSGAVCQNGEQESLGAISEKLLRILFFYSIHPYH